MKRNQYRLPVIVLAAFLIGIYFFLAARPAGAIGSPWVRWRINLDFPNDQLDAQLIIQRGHTTPAGNQIIDAEESFPISCQPKGNPTIKNGEAYFDGGSYYECDVPSIKEKAMLLWQINIPDTAPSRRPYIAGQITIEGNPINPNSNNPVFYREDIQFKTPIDVTTQKATMAMRFGQASAESGAFIINPAGHEFLAYLARSSPTAFSPFFAVDGNSLSATPSTITDSRIVSNLASTVYFGYSPVTGEYFEGSLGPLEVDPVCPTTG